MMNFEEHIRQMMSSNEANLLIESMNQKPLGGIRINLNKIDHPSFMTYFPYLKPHPIVPEGFIFENNQQYGKHVLHLAGGYYMQEPSAMIAAYLLDCKTGESVVDICAAPGGKATYAAMKIGDSGLLVANDSSFSRARILSENVERMGIKNALVTSNSIDELLLNYRGYFDKVILDAPCSGSGMFRKNPAVKDDWSMNKVLACSKIQKDLIVKAYGLLKKDGFMLYSTCSFSKEENEEVILHLLADSNAKLMKIPELSQIDRGIDLPQTIRIYPHHFPGEGHFMALIQSSDDKQEFSRQLSSAPPRQAMQLVKSFFNTYTNIQIDISQIIINQNHVHYLPSTLKGIPQLTILRSGLHLGELKTSHFEPSHAFACASSPCEWKHCLDFKVDSIEIKNYISGESFKVNTNIQGYCLICCQNMAIGYAKITDGILKNHFPKGLRQK